MQALEKLGAEKLGETLGSLQSIQSMTPFGGANDAVIPAPVGPTKSFGITSTPALGWACCNRPPCVCCGTPMYFSDNHKTWGETGEYNNKCCGGWTVKNARVKPAGSAYGYDFNEPMCCGEGLLIINSARGEVGRISTRSSCCNYDKVVFDAVDTTGKSLWTVRSPPCACCEGGCCCCSSGCFSTSCWNRTDSLFLSPGEGKPREPYVASAAWQSHRCLGSYYPWWFGYDTPPSSSEDESAILLGFLLLSAYSKVPTLQVPRVSAVPFTLGNVH